MEMNKLETAEWVDQKLRAMLLSTTPEPNVDSGWNTFRLRHSTAKKSRTLWISASAAAAVLLVAAIPPARAYATRCVEACVAESDRLGKFVMAKLRGNESTFSIQYKDRREAPDFTAEAADGRSIRLSDFRGSVVVLNFWATWCNPCRKEIPWFVEFQKEFGGQGFTMLGVSLDEDGWASVRPFLSEHGVNYPVVIGKQELVAAFGGLESLPATLIIDRNGRVAVSHAGLVPKATYEQNIRTALAESK